METKCVFVVLWSCEVVQTGTARCPVRAKDSWKRGGFSLNQFSIGFAGVWLLPCTINVLDIFFDRKERVSLCYPSSSSLDIYGEAVLCALTQLLELLAAGTAPWMLNSPTWIAEDDTLNLIWMPLQGVCWFLCCRQGFSLLGRDYGEKEEEESFELRNKEDLTPNGRVKTLHLH